MLQLRMWSLAIGALGGWLVVAGRSLANGTGPLAADSSRFTVLGGWALIALAVTTLLVGETTRRRSASSVEPAPRADAPGRGSIGRLIGISFVVLFVEVMLIRYTSAQIRIFSFYKNVPLIACFLGLGLGCWKSRGGPRQALTFLAWLLPLSAFLSLGSLVLADLLGRWASVASSEHILGDFAPTAEVGRAVSLWAQALMGLFCALTFVAIALLFVLLGRLLGSAFEGLPRIPAYTANIIGSLAGILGFLLLGYLETPPWLWFVVGLAPLLAWIPGDRRRLIAVALVMANVAITVPSVGNTVWSRYQKLVGVPLPAGSSGNATASDAYLVEISEVFYQVAVDLRPAALATMEGHPFPHYDHPYHGHPPPERVLVVGAGTGNDVAAALRADAGRVDAVDIDPAIIEMGRRHHPERPYDDPRVRVIVDDARRAFRGLEPGSYDLVVFGLLDSHTQLGMSSLRLDNYVFTLDSFAAARDLLRPGGRLLVSAATFREWFLERMLRMLEATCDTPVRMAQFGSWRNFTCTPAATAADTTVAEAVADAPVVLPTDDWPFLYLPRRSVPGAYIFVVLLLAGISVAILRLGGLEFRRLTPYHGHLFFLGAGFLLMEVYAINRLALLFGTTWLVSAVTIGLILTLIIAANLLITSVGRLPVLALYACLGASLLTGFFVGPEVALGRGRAIELAYGFMVVLPVFFAGLIFAQSFRRSAAAGQALGVNILGSVLGGWVEYGTMAVGIRAMGLLALVCYLASLLTWLRSAAPESDDSERLGELEPAKT